jgi:hypothetical protein
MISKSPHRTRWQAQGHVIGKTGTDGKFTPASKLARANPISSKDEAAKFDRKCLFEFHECAMVCPSYAVLVVPELTDNV